MSIPYGPKCNLHRVCIVLSSLIMKSLYYREIFLSKGVKNIIELTRTFEIVKIKFYESDY